MTDTTLPRARTRPSALPLQAADVRGLTRLGFDGVVGVTDIVEAMHHTIAARTLPLGAAPAGRTSGITGFVYRTVRGSTRIIGKSCDVLLRALAPPAKPGLSTPAREATLAVLNGIWGDHLVASGNPLAIPTSLRVAGRRIDPRSDDLAAVFPQASGRVVVLAHGLCMNDLQWTRDGHDHGRALARDLGMTPLYLHYNSGRHVSDNGRDCAELLDVLLARWPVPVEELVLIGHSMGGLVLRSACHQAALGGQRWPATLTRLVFLGTPHHGAPLERGGRWVDTLLGISPYAAPFARLGKARSAGITDLRYGNLQQADWQHRDRHSQRQDDRQPTPLPDGVQTFVVAGVKAPTLSGARGVRRGDGLVPLASALGEHRDARHALAVPASRQYVATSAGHWDLLSRADVYVQLRDWLKAKPRRRRAE